MHIFTFAIFLLCSNLGKYTACYCHLLFISYKMCVKIFAFNSLFHYRFLRRKASAMHGPTGFMLIVLWWFSGDLGDFHTYTLCVCVCVFFLFFLRPVEDDGLSWYRWYKTRQCC
jgi:hypothetical protein